MTKFEPFKVKVAGEIEVKKGGVFESKVVQRGNEAVIPAFKEFIGKEVLVILDDKIKRHDRSWDDIFDMPRSPENNP
jgi:putative transposon-encoded protein